MRKIIPIIIIFIFIFTSIGYSSQNTYYLRPTSLFQKKPGKLILNIIDLMRDRQWRPAYRFTIRLPNNTVLEEPSGFPGKWVVTLGDGVEKKDNSMAQAMRLAKSFSISCLDSGRREINTAHFIITREFPAGGEILFSCDDFIIRRNPRYSLEIFVHPDFLDKPIPDERKVFKNAIQNLPGDITHSDVKSSVNGLVSAQPVRKKKVIIFNNPFDDKYSAPLSPASFGLGSMLKKENDMEVLISRANYESMLKGMELDADAVIFSVTQQDISMLRDIIKKIREKRPNIAILCGGPAATIMGEHVAAHVSEANVVYRGDVDGRLDKLVRASIAAQAAPESAPDMFKDLQGGIYSAGNTFYFNECGLVNRVTEEELENRQLDWSLAKYEYLRTSFSFMTGVGCNHRHCIFCATGAEDRYISMSAEKVAFIAEKYAERFNVEVKEHPISSANRLPFPTIHFNDDNIFADKPRLIRILELLRSSRSGVKLESLMGRLEDLFIGDKPGERKVDTEFLDAVANARDVFSDGPLLYFGTDHLVVPKEFGKGDYTYEEIQNVMEECKKRKIKNVHFQIMTHPYMRTETLLLQMIRMVQCTAKYGEYTYFLAGNTNFGITPYLCTPIYNKVVRDSDAGLVLSELDYKPAELTQIRGFPEYDYYDNTNVLQMFSKLIPLYLNTNCSYAIPFFASQALRSNHVDMVVRQIRVFNVALSQISKSLDSDSMGGVVEAVNKEVINEWLKAKSILSSMSEQVDEHWTREIETSLREVQEKMARYSSLHQERNPCRSQI